MPMSEDPLRIADSALRMRHSGAARRAMRNARCAVRVSPMPPFVPPGSVVRRIWGEADSILLVFAGAAAEFALNRAVDWLFYTGALPADPIGRVFSTAAFAQEIVFVDDATAQRTLGRIRAIHE